MVWNGLPLTHGYLMLCFDMVKWPVFVTCDHEDLYHYTPRNMYDLIRVFLAISESCSSENEPYIWIDNYHYDGRIRVLCEVDELQRILEPEGVAPCGAAAGL